MGTVCVACVGALPLADDGAGGASGTTRPAEPLDQTEAASEPTEEAAQGWTAADCRTAWKHNLQVCNSAPPNLRPECWAACAVFLAGCLAAAQG